MINKEHFKSDKYGAMKGNVITTLSGHTGDIRCCSISNSPIIVSTSSDNTFKIWKLRSTLNYYYLRHKIVGSTKKNKSITGYSTFESCAITKDSRLIVTGNAEGHVQVWTPSGKEVSLMVHNIENSFPVNYSSSDEEYENIDTKVSACAISDSGNIIVSVCDREVIIWKYPTDSMTGASSQRVQYHKKKKISPAHEDIINGCVIFKENYFITCSSDATAKIWNISHSEPLKIINERDEHNSSENRGLNSVAISPTGKRILTASVDKTLKVYHWNIRKRSIKFMCILKGHLEEVKSCAFMESDRRIISASTDTLIKIWDVDEKICLKSIKAHLAPIHWVAVSENGAIAVSASQDRSLKIIDVAPTGESIQMDSYVESIPKQKISQISKLLPSITKRLPINLTPITKTQKKKKKRKKRNKDSSQDIEYRLSEDLSNSSNEIDMSSSTITLHPSSDIDNTIPDDSRSMDDSSTDFTDTTFQVSEDNPEILRIGKRVFLLLLLNSDNFTLRSVSCTCTLWRSYGTFLQGYLSKIQPNTELALDRSSLVMLVGDYYLETKNYLKARKVWSENLTVKPTKEVYIRCAEACLVAVNEDKSKEIQYKKLAILDYEEARKIDPKDTMIRFRLVEILCSQATTKGLDHALSVLRGVPDTYEKYLKTAEINEKLGRLNIAIQFYNQCIELSPSDDIISRKNKLSSPQDWSADDVYSFFENLCEIKYEDLLTIKEKNWTGKNLLNINYLDLEGLDLNYILVSHYIESIKNYSKNITGSVESNLFAYDWYFTQSIIKYPDWIVSRKMKDFVDKQPLYKSLIIIEETIFDVKYPDAYDRLNDILGKMNGWRIDKAADLERLKIYAVQNSVLEQHFDAKLKLLGGIRENREYNKNISHWRQEPKAELRQKVLDHANKYIMSFSWNDGKMQNVVPMFHGTKHEYARQIAHHGFLKLKKLDTGWYGSGIYFTNDFQHATTFSRKAYKSDHKDNKRCVILSLIIPGEIFPVIESISDEANLRGKEIETGYQSHYAVVRKNSGEICDPDTPNCISELAVNTEHTAVLPMYVIVMEEGDM